MYVIGVFSSYYDIVIITKYFILREQSPIFQANKQILSQGNKYETRI